MPASEQAHDDYVHYCMLARLVHRCLYPMCLCFADFLLSLSLTFEDVDTVDLFVRRFLRVLPYV